MTWIFSFVPQAQHHFAARRTQTNDVALRANDALRNDVGLRPTMLRFAQTDALSV